MSKPRSHCVGNRTRKWCQAALWVGNLGEVFMWWHSTLGLRNRRAASFHGRICRLFLSCTSSAHNDGPPASSNTQWDHAELLLRRALLPSSETYMLHDSAEPAMASIFLQHANKFASSRTRESCSLLHRVEGKPVSWILLPPITYLTHTPLP